MSNLEPLPTWLYLFVEARKIEEYDDLNSEFNSLIAKVENTQEITEEDNNNFYVIKKQWKRIIADKSNEIKNVIEKMSIESYQIHQSWKMLAIGFLFGVVSSVIAGILLFKIFQIF